MTKRGPYRRDPNWHLHYAGTERGAQRHRRYGEPVCDSCRAASNAAHADRARARRARQDGRDGH